MYRAILPFALLLICLLGGQHAAAQNGKQWKLVWQDEFSGEGKPDSTKWRFSGRAKPDWACFCFDDTTTVVVRNGHLLVKGIVAKPGTDTARFQTGCVQTKGLFSFRYGKMEVRARLPKGQGSWPAIWLMPEKAVYGGWPKSGEIDVMEHLNRDSFFYQTLHSAYIDELKKKDHPKHFATAAFEPDAFNMFGMEWYPDRIDFLINGKLTFTYPKIEADTTGRQWPFDQDFYIILNQALGGNWPGPVDETVLPQVMAVDYVRVYQLQ